MPGQRQLPQSNEMRCDKLSMHFGDRQAFYSTANSGEYGLFEGSVLQISNFQNANHGTVRRQCFYPRQLLLHSLLEIIENNPLLQLVPCSLYHLAKVVEWNNTIAVAHAHQHGADNLHKSIPEAQKRYEIARRNVPSPARVIRPCAQKTEHLRQFIVTQRFEERLVQLHFPCSSSHAALVLQNWPEKKRRQSGTSTGPASSGGILI